MRKQKAFTIIELIVVIAIIAILASVVMVSVTQYIEKSRMAAFKENLKTAQLCFTQSFVEDGGYQNGFSDCTNSITAIRKAFSSISDNIVYNLGDKHDSYCLAYVDNSTNFTYCIDSSGFFGELNCGRDPLDDEWAMCINN